MIFSEYTRRAIAYVEDGTALIRCPGTSNACSVKFTQRTSKPDGWYRCKAWFSGSMESGDLGAKINPAREADRLDKLSAIPVRARTLSPGISGFQERERASQSAGEARKYESRQLANLLREWSRNEAAGK